MSDTKRRLQRIATTFNAKARKQHVPGVISWEMLAALGTRCAYCGIEIDLDHGSWDHVVPFSKGGVNTLVNLVRCCTTCQRAKFTKTPLEHAQAQSLVVQCARPGCGQTFKPRWAEHQRGMARFCSHRCAGMAKGKGW